jgi:hypothetical protein
VSRTDKQGGCGVVSEECEFSLAEIAGRAGSMGRPGIWRSPWVSKPTFRWLVMVNDKNLSRLAGNLGRFAERVESVGRMRTECVHG